MTDTTYAQFVATAHAYLDSLAVRDPGRLALSASCRFTENCADSSMTSGLWATASAVTYRQVFADTEAGQVGVFAVVEESGVPAVFAARIRVLDGLISEVETIVTREGESSIMNAAALQTPNPIWAPPIAPVALTRDEIAGAADAYFQALQDDSTAHVRFHPECQRVENGVQTTSTPRTGGLGTKEQIDKKMFVYIRELRERRFPLVDVERGLVLGIAFLDVPGDVATVEVDGVVRELPAFMRTPRSTLLFELFKVGDGGQIRQIEAMMINRPFGTKSGWV